MTPTSRTVGGSPVPGLPQDFMNFLQQGLTTGMFGNPGQAAWGAQPIGQTQGLAGMLNDVLSGGAGKLGGSLQQIIQQQQAGDVANLRARYSMGGTGTGTPSGYAESLYRAQAAPRAAVQIGNLQRSWAEPLMQMMYGLTQRGTPQAVTTLQQSPLMQMMSMLPGLAGGAGSVMRALPRGAPGADLSAPPIDMEAISAGASGVPAFDPAMLMTAMGGGMPPGFDPAMFALLMGGR